MKIKKIIAALCTFLLVAAYPVGAAAEENTQQNNNSGQPAVSVNAKSAIMVEQSTGKVLYQNNIHEKMYPASITKIMTELLVLQAIENKKLSFNDKITCSAHAASMGGSDIWLKAGEVMSVNDLFKAMAVNSANDAAVALGEKIAGSEPAFVNLMNTEAKKLGMNDSHFSNCTGLDADDNLTSAYDVMLMSSELIKHEEIFNYTTIWMDTLRDGKTALYNTNRLIRFYNGANGLKTGSTSKAGYCLSATAKRDNMQLIAVVLNCPTVKDRFSSAENLLDYGFANYSRVSAKIKNPNINVKVLHGVKSSVQAVPDSSPSVLVAKGKEDSIQQKVSVVPNVMAPVTKGQVVGQITFTIDGNTVGTVSLKAKESVEKLNFASAFAKLYKGMARG